jgi:uncharacterized protein
VFKDPSHVLLSTAPGVGLRAAHVNEVLARRPDVAWFEVHPENYMADPAAQSVLQRVREHYAVSLHGVGLSLGSAGPLSLRHLRRLKSLIEHVQPMLISEHLAWSASENVHLNELLPLPYTEESLDIVTAHVHQTQATIRRRILIENPSSYLRFRHSTMPEAAFLTELVRRTGCGLLLDINNLYVNTHNVGTDARDYLATIPPRAIGEIHLAGHSRSMSGGKVILIDDHGSRVSEDVWALYRTAIQAFGYRPTLIEWDTELPSLDTLLREAARAESVSASLDT